MTTLEYVHALVEKVCKSKFQIVQTDLIGEFRYILAPIPLKKVENVRFWELDIFDQEGCTVGDGNSITGDTLSQLLEHAKKKGIDLENTVPLEAWDIIGEE
jgi:hypothetical protein